MSLFYIYVYLQDCESHKESFAKEWHFQFYKIQVKHFI